MNKPATVFFVSIISLVLLSGAASVTHTQADGNKPPPPAVIDCPIAWHVVASPSPDPSSSGLNGVAVVSATDVWAVGYSISGTITEHWDGTSWGVVPDPDTSGAFYGVAAISATDVWAVGYDISGTLTEHWDGSSWSVVPSPSPDASSSLNGVAAVSANDVWAVGDSYSGTLTEHWNGITWSVVPSPNPVPGRNYLTGVSAVASNDIWAVGNYGGYTLIEHWNGSSWSIVPSPNPSAGGNYPNKISAAGPNDVWAVGYSDSSDNPVSTLIEHWNGSSWSVVSSPNPDPSGNNLSGVTAISATDVWAVGSDSNGTLTENWDGTSWSVVPSPNPDPNRDSNHLYAVAALSANEVWAVGDTRFQTNTLVEHYTASGCGSPVPTNCPAPFLDISNDVFRNAIAYLVCQGAINGTSSYQYSPGSTATRGQFAKVVVLAFGLPIYTPTSGQDFTDVAPSYYAYRNIETGYHAGILSGFDANTCAAYGAQSPCYLPNLAITRGQTTALVVSAAHFALVTPTSGNPSFTDVPASNLFYVTIETAYAHGLIDGYPDRTFRPNNSIRRDEMAQIVYTGITTP